MKQILLLAFIFCSMSLSAQSLIVTTSGQPITGYDVTVTPNGVFYRSSENSDAQFLKIATDSVSLVRHSDGTIINVAEQASTPVTPQSTPAADTSQTADPNDYLDHEYNKAMIAKYNTPAEIVFNEDKKKIKRLHRIAFQHYATEDSQFATEDLVVTYHFWCKSTYNFTNDRKVLVWNGTKIWGHIPLIYIQIKNTSDKTIYIDLANTFLIKNDESEPYYIPGATSTIGGGTTGTSVNLGGVAKAAGIGGSVGALAGAVNVNNSQTKFTTNTVYSQRVIAIPPYSTQILEEKFYISKETSGINSFNATKVSAPGGGKMPYIAFRPESEFEYFGDQFEWDENTSPQKISCFLTYSFSEDISNSRKLRSSLYVKRGIASEIDYSVLTEPYEKHYFSATIPKINCAIDDNVVILHIKEWE